MLEVRAVPAATRMRDTSQESMTIHMWFVIHAFARVCLSVVGSPQDNLHTPPICMRHTFHLWRTRACKVESLCLWRKTPWSLVPEGCLGAVLCLLEKAKYRSPHRQLTLPYRSPHRFTNRRAYRSRTSGLESLATPISDICVEYTSHAYDILFGDVGDRLPGH